MCRSPCSCSNAARRRTGAPEAAGYTPLHWAVNRSEALTSHDYPDAPGEWAALAGIPDRRQQLALIEALLDHGADVNAQLTKLMPRYGFSLYFLILPPNTMVGFHALSPGGHGGRRGNDAVCSSTAAPTRCCPRPAA